MKRPCVVVAAALAMAAGAAPAQAQHRQLAGRVVDARTGLPLTVGLVSLTAGVSDQLRPDGVFVMRVPPGAVRLTVRSPGYERREIVVPEDQQVVLVQLERIAQALDAVVVTAGSTGEPFRPGSPASVEEILGGRVVGLESMSNSGAPADIQVRLRGVSTILGHGRPLWVLDGVVIQDVGPTSGAGALVGGPSTVPSRIADLNPNDIAFVEVLRGASAAAMYGSRGASGVVVVRTKRG